MRPHRKFEIVSSRKLTVQVPVMTPRQLMKMLSDDIEIDVKARSGTFGNGSEQYPIPRSMSIARIAQMTPKKVVEQSPTPSAPPAPPTSPPPPEG